MKREWGNLIWSNINGFSCFPNTFLGRLDLSGMKVSQENFIGVRNSMERKNKGDVFCITPTEYPPLRNIYDQTCSA